MKKNLLAIIAMAVIIGISSITNADVAIFGDTTYKANESISRAETAKVLVNFLLTVEGELEFNDRADHTYKCGFTDVSKLNDDARKYIWLACSHGLFKGNGGKFRPNDTLTWAEALTLLARIDKANITEGNPWWMNYRNYAIQKGRFRTRDIVRAEENITQEQFAALLANFLREETENNLKEIQNNNEFTNTTWILKEFNGNEVIGDYTMTINSENRLNITFCNIMNGVLTVEGNKLNALLASTKMACLDKEKAELEDKFNLEDANFIITKTRMATNNIEHLIITTINWDTYAFLKETANEIDITGEYGLRKVNETDVSKTYLLLITKDTISIKFCNNINWSYTLEGNTIKGTLMSTLMLCLDNEEASDLESKFNINNATVERDFDNLTITTEEGNVFEFIMIYR